MNCWFLGTSGPLGTATLKALLDGNAPITHVVIADDTPAATTSAPEASPLKVAIENNLFALAHLHDVSHSHLPDNGNAGIHDHIKSTATRLGRPTLIVVSCLGTILSREVLALASDGFYNVHPSRLPAYRGPSPAFWQLRDKASTGGVSVHRMTEHIDAGESVYREHVAWPDAIVEQLAEALAGAQAGQWLSGALARLTSLPPLAPADVDSYQSEPAAGDFDIDASKWTAPEALRFIRGTYWRRQPYHIHTRNWHAIVVHASSVRERTADAAPFGTGDTVFLPMACGRELVAEGVLNPSD